MRKIVLIAGLFLISIGLVACYSLHGTGKATSSITGTFAPRISLLCLVDCLFTTLIKISGNRFDKKLKATLNKWYCKRLGIITIKNKRHIKCHLFFE
ncbi:hypothetical protein AZF37_08565 [endosymbiont 'TC1' of Trimyema compressum]|uniref:hypothetical protein n=1 Tax=endosymbiont 'TC1' of Trimyema compressum TaxID=243899 RepID=UPI0007F0618E|nr:hypothetical protein [endosymbiont 'TC1' of Trimyema compressum]AMP21199.1 hypothetical protein AZF37_08565 [endosymbiont 'TC1' of Trimyema compressum]